MGKFPFVLRLAVPGDLDRILGLIRDAADWLRGKNTDQWQQPWPDRAGQRERILNGLLRGKTWLAWDGRTVAATITIDTDEPLDLAERPVWPADESRRPALYVRRVIVGRRYAGLELGAALLNWAADVARRDHGAELIRVDVWTTNRELHAYYNGQGFTRYRPAHPREPTNYPSQALFQREVDRPGTDFTKLLLADEGQDRTFRR